MSSLVSELDPRQFDMMAQFRAIERMECGAGTIAASVADALVVDSTDFRPFDDEPDEWTRVFEAAQDPAFGGLSAGVKIGQQLLRGLTANELDQLQEAWSQL